jgi:hypothetical protein
MTVARTRKLLSRKIGALTSIVAIHFFAAQGQVFRPRTQVKDRQIQRRTRALILRVWLGCQRTGKLFAHYFDEQCPKFGASHVGNAINNGFSRGSGGLDGILNVLSDGRGCGSLGHEITPDSSIHTRL